jgi:hypothetical protein
VKASLRTVERCNEGRLAVQLIERQMRRHLPGGEKWNALWHALYLVRQDLEHHQECLAEACAPWFDVPQGPKLGFADAVRRHGDRWLYDDAIWKATQGQQPRISAATWIAMRSSSTDTERRDALRMELCEKHERVFQIERPVYLCGCDALCDKHPECPGAKWTPGFPYRHISKALA